MKFDLSAVVFLVMAASPALAQKARYAPPRVIAEEISHGRIPDLAVYRTGLRLVGSMPSDKRVSLLRLMLGDAELSEPQLKKIAARAGQLHGRLLAEESPTQRAQGQAVMAMMRRLEREIGREAVTVLGMALKAKIRPNVELVPIAGLRSEGGR
jgi:hypothetical protein